MSFLSFFPLHELFFVRFFFPLRALLILSIELIPQVFDRTGNMRLLVSVATEDALGKKHPLLASDELSHAAYTKINKAVKDLVSAKAIPSFLDKPKHS